MVVSKKLTTFYFIIIIGGRCERKAKAVIIGHAIGDALGGSVEFVSREFSQ